MTYFVVFWLSFNCPWWASFASGNMWTATAFCNATYEQKTRPDKAEALKLVKKLGREKFPAVFEVHGSRVTEIPVTWEPVIK